MRNIVVGVIALGCGLPATSVAGQTVSAVPKLDLDRFMGTWYDVARFPTKADKQCVSDATVLYALGDKANAFQVGSFCQKKGGVPSEVDANGKADKQRDGKLKLRRIWPFSAKYWVLALGPNYEWALVGTPNHKSLWILSRSAVMEPGLLAQIEAKATAEGFKTAKLVTISQHH